jgi:hypothetical protein
MTRTVPTRTRGASETSYAATRLYPTKNDLSEATRTEAIGLLNQRLADCINLQTQCNRPTGM